MIKTYKDLEDYGIIGNLLTSALVGKDGSIDWCCFPHLESPSVFCAILDIHKGGLFSITPNVSYISKQTYITETNVLETDFKTDNGEMILTDFMPAKVRQEQSSLNIVFRKIKCISGSIPLQIVFEPRFNYARELPRFYTTDDQIIAEGKDKNIYLQTHYKMPLIPVIKETGVYLELEILEGEECWVLMKYNYNEILSPYFCQKILTATINFWQSWAHICDKDNCVFNGPWHDLVVRSGLVLKLLTHRTVGSIAAAPTTSLPEAIGGERNWDYRYSWIRDASFTIRVLYSMDHGKEAEDYFNWLKNKCLLSLDPEKMKIMYSLEGESNLQEQILDYLEGYKHSYPVRIGNAASEQKQLDIYGEFVLMMHDTLVDEKKLTQEEWIFISKICDYVCKVWNTVDSGIWEVRGGPQHFTYSKLMCWVALDRAILILHEFGLNGDVEKWVNTRDSIKQAILEKGFNKTINSFLQILDPISTVLDATNLLIPIMGLLPIDDPRVQGTIDATEKYLTKNGLVYRYTSNDGLHGKEGTFILCTFWLVNTLALSGKIDQAEEYYKRILQHASPLGLLAEEFDPETKKQIGNYPQAFSHLGLINSARYIGLMKNKNMRKQEPMREEKISVFHDLFRVVSKVVRKI